MVSETLIEATDNKAGRVENSLDESALVNIQEIKSSELFWNLVNEWSI